jgi:CubicO group peptidase (beta-lactamase class C family)
VARLFVLMAMVVALSPTTEDVSARVDRLFAEWNKPDTPGASIAVIRDGRIVLSKGYGSANLEYGAAVTPDTVFHVASVSKQFTAMALVLLEQDGKLTLEDDVRKHLPQLHDFGSTITPRQLLQHTSGIRDQWQTLALAGWRLDDIITQNQILDMMYRQKELNFKPGVEHLYSNGGYTLAAEIVRRASAKTLREFCDERIFKPLGMTRTHFHDDLRMIVKNRAMSYRQVGDRFENSPLNYENVGATSLFTTAEDLVRWLDNFRDSKVGGRSAIDKLQQQAVLADGKKIPYALGISIDEYRGLKRISHGGGDASFRAMVSWYPEANLGVAVLSNLGSLNVGERAQQLAEAFIEDRMTPKPAAAASKAELKPVPVDPQKLAQHTGIYRSPQGIMEIEVKDGKLLGSPAGAPRQELVPVEGERFVVQAIKAEVRFVEEAGKKWIVIRQQQQNELRGERISKELPDSQRDLAEYAGIYWSDELETRYTAVLEDGMLRLRHVRHGKIELRPIAGDTFRSGSWFMNEIVFTRDSQGRISGMRAGGGRVRSVAFTRRTEAGPSD